MSLEIARISFFNPLAPFPPKARVGGGAIDAPPARLAGEILREMGLDGEPAGVPFGSDASKLSRQGVPSLVFGPGNIDRAHVAVEYVEIDQVVQAEAFFREFLPRFE